MTLITEPSVGITASAFAKQRHVYVVVVVVTIIFLLYSHGLLVSPAPNKGSKRFTPSTYNDVCSVH